jgi:hypothetical protein
LARVAASRSSDRAVAEHLPNEGSSMRKASSGARKLVARHLDWGGCGTVAQIAAHLHLSKQAVHRALQELEQQGQAFHKLTQVQMHGNVEGLVYTRECRWWSGSSSAEAAPSTPNLPMVQRALAAQPDLALVWGRAQA